MEERPTTADVLINLVAFQVAWFSLVLGAAQGWVLMGQAVAIAVIALHLYRTPSRLAEAKLLVAALGIGLVVESGLLVGEFVGHASPGPVEGLAPFWLLLMWPAFATLLNVSARPLRPWIVAAALGGCAVVPVAYYVGSRLGAMTMPEPFFRSLSVIGLAWAFALPLLFWLAQRFDGWRQE